MEGFTRRDAFVPELPCQRRIPAVTGDYAADLNDTVEADCLTARIAPTLL